VLPGGYGVAIGPGVETGKAEAKARKVKYPQQKFTDPPRKFLSNIDQGQNRSGGGSRQRAVGVCVEQL